MNESDEKSAIVRSFSLLHADKTNAVCEGKLTFSQVPPPPEQAPPPPAKQESIKKETTEIDDYDEEVAQATSFMAIDPLMFAMHPSMMMPRATFVLATSTSRNTGAADDDDDDNATIVISPLPPAVVETNEKDNGGKKTNKSSVEEVDE